ncbi:contact-dependent growth inhibition system immunity protein [Paenibacillus sp. SAF-068]|uniref:contact-dependent growth inhibition system immunity protein n=1 Tax=Paenibacillus sp. SAF-068 TaxID=3436864 RepID=UPI003F7F883A
MQEVDLTETLEELEDERWDEPNFDSRLVLRANELRKKPLCELNNEDLRLLIGQQMSLDILLPLEIRRFVHGGFILFGAQGRARVLDRT